MAEIKISVKNQSTLLTDQLQIERAVQALQTQVTRDFFPVWGVSADLDLIPTNADFPKGHWWLLLLDNTDQANDLGYHDITTDGLPLGKVFAATDKVYGSEWTVTASHELLEMLGDPAINLTAFQQTSFDVQQNTIGRLYSYEVCDACEADKYGYMIDDVLVSDFVYPAWFEGFRSAGSTQFDYGNYINQPFQLLPGGYISVYDMTSGTGWQQVTSPLFIGPGAGASPMASRPPVGSRRERRRTPRSQWVPSKLRVK